MAELTPVEPREGTAVLHLFHRLDPGARAELPATAGKDLAARLETIGERVQLHVFSALGHKADVMLMALARDLNDLRWVQSELQASEAAPALPLAWSYLSLTEVSEYTPTEAEERERLAELGVEDAEFERRLQKFVERIDGYNRHKLYPEMPAWEAACFYPMSHRREGQDNWYSLPYEERRRLMHEHGRSGRAYTGRVVQLVSGSAGLDDWEWGVTLFAHDVQDLKEIVYQLRYDEASARYGEFGPFVVGLRRQPDELVRDLGLGATD